MNWLDRAETKFGHLAIPGLPRIIVGFNALVFVLFKLSPTYVGYLDLNPALVRHGQVWRLVTFLFIPQVGGMMLDWLFLLFYLLYLLFIGSGLEQAMGAFKLNVYYLLGMVGVAAASMLFAPDFAPFLLNASLLFAFARHYPETVLYISFILPVKVKWMAWFTAGWMALQFLWLDWAYRATVLSCVANYLIFFGPEHVREWQHRGGTMRRDPAAPPLPDYEGEALHECAVCGRTEHNSPYLDFRVARDGKEYCADHLAQAGPA